MVHPRVAVVILNWNGKKFLKDFLPGVLEYSAEEADIYVVDNRSSDDSVTFLKIAHPSIKLIENEENYGFAGGYNAGLKQIDADYYILLNSDIEVTKDWINPVITWMEADRNIAACQPKIRSFYEPEMFEYAGAAGGFIDKNGYPFCRGRIFQTIEKDVGQYDDRAEVFWATGACMFVRSELFFDAGGFDDGFFAHMEEIDLCWRLKNQGYKIAYCPDSTVFHVGGGTLPKESSRKTFLNMRNNLFMLYKNLPEDKLSKVLKFRYLMDGVAALKFLKDGGWKNFKAVVKAHRSFREHKRQLNEHRKQTSKTNVSNIYDGNIVKEYFLNGKKHFSDLDKQKFTR